MSRRRAASPLRLDRKTIDLRLRHTWTIARSSSALKRNVLTRVTKEGIEGLGEAAPNERYGEDARSVHAALDRLEPLLGDDPERLDAILDRLDAALPDEPAARASVDIALHDWLGRKTGVPLYRLFGADPDRAPLTSMSIGIDALPLMQEKARQAADFRILKVKVGAGRDREILEAIRATTDVPLYVDANEGWTDARAAVETIRWMKSAGVVLVEQPLPAADLEGARFVRERAGLPIIADEAARTLDDLPALARAFDGINVKLQKSGGLRAARRMIERARSLGMTVMIGCMVETSIGITAAAHLSPLADFADLDGHLLIENDPFRGVSIREGRLVLPNRPGLGIQGSW